MSVGATFQLTLLASAGGNPVFCWNAGICWRFERGQIPEKPSKKVLTRDGEFGIVGLTHGLTQPTS